MIDVDKRKSKERKSHELLPTFSNQSLKRSAGRPQNHRIPPTSSRLTTTMNSPRKRTNKFYLFINYWIGWLNLGTIVFYKNQWISNYVHVICHSLFVVMRCTIQCGSAGRENGGDNTRNLEAMMLLHQRQQLRKKEAKNRNAPTKPQESLKLKQPLRWAFGISVFRIKGTVKSRTYIVRGNNNISSSRKHISVKRSVASSLQCWQWHSLSRHIKTCDSWGAERARARNGSTS